MRGPTGAIICMSLHGRFSGSVAWLDGGRHFLVRLRRTRELRALQELMIVCDGGV